MDDYTMTENRGIWIDLAPRIVDRAILQLKEIKSVNNVQFKCLNISCCENVEAIFTVCYRVSLRLDVDGSERTLAIFVKVLAELKEDLYKLFSLDEKFGNETFVYEKLLPALNPSVHFPTFYYSHVKKLDAALAISDFSVDGFSMSKSFVNLSLDHILVSMKAIGNFHGAAFALKHNNPSQMDALRSELIDARFKQEPTFNVVLKNALKRAINSFHKSAYSESVTKAFLKDFETLFGDELDRFLPAKFEVHEPLAVICHGDFLRNNIAFRYDSDGRATDAMIFDWQTVRYGSPMLDVCTFMAMSTGFAVRQQHFDQIFRTYHDAVVEQFLVKTGLSKDGIPDYMSYNAFLKEYTLYLPFGFHIACYFLGQLTDPIHLVEQYNLGNADFVWTQGGEAVDRETTAQIIDIYNFYTKFDLSLLNF